MTHPLLEQFQHWIKQLENSSERPFSEQLAQWQQWIGKFSENTHSLSANHADLVKHLTDYSRERVELLAELARAQAKGESVEALAQRLRSELHQFNVKQTLAHARLPQEFLGLVFTQLEPAYTLSSEQIEALRQATQQLEHPRFAQLRALIDALIEWQASSAKLSQALDRVSHQALDAFQAGAHKRLEQDQLLKLWVECYDDCYRDAFNAADLQQAQAELINSLTQLQLSWQALVDQLAEQVGLPSRSQIDQIIAEFDQQRRRIRALEREVETLRAQVRSDL